MDATTFIKRMKSFMPFLEYCESHNLIKEDEDIFDCESYYYDDSDFDSFFTELWIRKFHFILSPYTNISFLENKGSSVTLKVNRDNCFEKIIEGIEKLKNIN